MWGELQGGDLLTGVAVRLKFGRNSEAVRG